MRVREFVCLLLLAGIVQGADPEITGPSEVKPGGFARLTAGAGLPVKWSIDPKPVMKEVRKGELTFTGEPGIEYTVTATIVNFDTKDIAEVERVVKFLPAGSLPIPPVIPAGAVPKVPGVPLRQAPAVKPREVEPEAVIDNPSAREASRIYREAKGPNVSVAPRPAEKASAAAPFVSRPALASRPTTPAIGAKNAARPNTSFPATSPTGSTSTRTLTATVGGIDPNCTT